MWYVLGMTTTTPPRQYNVTSIIYNFSTKPGYRLNCCIYVNTVVFAHQSKICFHFTIHSLKFEFLELLTFFTLRKFNFLIQFIFIENSPNVPLNKYFALTPRVLFIFRNHSRNVRNKLHYEYFLLSICFLYN